MGNNRHSISARMDRVLLQARFGVEYALDPASTRWFHDYETPEELQEAQEYLRSVLIRNSRQELLILLCSCYLLNKGMDFYDLRISDLNPEVVIADLADGRVILVNSSELLEGGIK